MQFLARVGKYFCVRGTPRQNFTVTPNEWGCFWMLGDEDCSKIGEGSMPSLSRTSLS